MHKQEQKEIRERELQERADKYIEKGKLPEDKALKIMKEQEKINKEYSNIQRELDRKKVCFIDEANSSRGKGH